MLQSEKIGYKYSIEEHRDKGGGYEKDKSICKDI